MNCSCSHPCPQCVRRFEVVEPDWNAIADRAILDNLMSSPTMLQYVAWKTIERIRMADQLAIASVPLPPQEPYEMPPGMTPWTPPLPWPDRLGIRS